MLDWARAAGFAAILAVALAGTLHFALYYPPPSYSPTEPGTPEANERQREQDQKLAIDRGLLWFTAVLSVATLALMVATVGLVVYAARQLRDTRQSAADTMEARRAHVSGGANWIKTDDEQLFLVVTINNYGRTPATIGTVAATICEEGELDTFPGWSVNAWPGHPFVKQWKGYVFGEVRGQQIDIRFPFPPKKVITGRIWYRDIFKTGRFVGFLLDTDNLLAIGRKEFWEEREEKDPNE
jgi:hypothetical protein